MRRTFGWILTGLGLLLLAGSFVWREVVLDRLLKYPTDVDETLEFEGTATLFVDPATFAPFDTPQEFPLEASRQIKADPEQSSSDLVVVQENIDLSAPGLVDAAEQNFQYVWNRKTMENVSDSRAWAFEPSNVVDRSGLFRLSFPFDTPQESLPVYNNQADVSYENEFVGTGEVEGLVVNRYAASLPFTPAVQPFLEVLAQAAPLPPSVTLDQLKPLLLSKGLDIDAILPTLIPQLAPEDAAVLLGLAEAPIGLQYVYSIEVEDEVEPSTGQPVRVSNVLETVAARPDPEALPPLVAVLGKYPSVPEAVTALNGLNAVAEPTPVVQFAYDQTDASVAELADTVRDARDEKHLGEDIVPMAMIIGGATLTGLGLLLALWRSRYDDDEDELYEDELEASDYASSAFAGESGSLRVGSETVATDQTPPVGVVDQPPEPIIERDGPRSRPPSDPTSRSWAPPPDSTGRSWAPPPDPRQSGS